MRKPTAKPRTRNERELELLTRIGPDLLKWVGDHPLLVRALMQGEAFIRVHHEEELPPLARTKPTPAVAPDSQPEQPTAEEQSLATAERKAAVLARFKSAPVEVTVVLHRRTTKAVQVSLDGNIDEDVWLPRSLTWIRWLGDGWAEITIYPSKSPSKRA